MRRTVSRSSGSNSRRAKRLSASSTLCAQWSPVRRALPVSCMSSARRKRSRRSISRQQRGEALLPVVSRLAQGVHVVDDQEGVLIDGVAMIGVADDQRINAVEFGNDKLKHAERVHGAQGVCGVGADQDFAQAVPKKWTFGHLHGKHRQSFGDVVFGTLTQLVAVGGDKSEDAQNTVGVGDGALIRRGRGGPVRERNRFRRPARGGDGIVYRKSGAAAAHRPSAERCGGRWCAHDGSRCASSRRGRRCRGFQGQCSVRRLHPAHASRACCRRGRSGKCRKHRAAARKSKADSISLWTAKKALDVGFGQVFCSCREKSRLSHCARW